MEDICRVDDAFFDISATEDRLDKCESLYEPKLCGTNVSVIVIFVLNTSKQFYLAQLHWGRP